MSNLVSVNEKNMQAVESALVRNDISKLSTQERIAYLHNLCASVGLNPMTKPFAFITLQGKETIYAQKDCAEQLRKIHGVSVQILEKKVESGLYIVTVKAKDKTGRTDEATGIIPIEGLKGADLANAMLKTETKAKRRVTLSLCGLGILDESELETVSNVGFASNPQVENPFKKEEPKDVTPAPEYDEEIFQGGPELGDFEIKIGKKYKGMKLQDVDQFELDSYVKWIIEDARKKSKDLPSDYQEFVDVAEAYLKSKEAK